MFQCTIEMFAAEYRCNLTLQPTCAHALSLCLCSCSSSSGCQFQSRRRREIHRRSPPPPGPSAEHKAERLCTHSFRNAQHWVCDVGAITCISSKVSSSLHRLFFFSSRLSPLSRASRAVASPGAPSRFGASSASNKAALARGGNQKKRRISHLRCAFTLTFYARMAPCFAQTAPWKSSGYRFSAPSIHSPQVPQLNMEPTLYREHGKLCSIFLKLKQFCKIPHGFLKASSILQLAAQVDFLVSFNNATDKRCSGSYQSRPL